ncbi:MAG: hypothetical protein WCP14_04095 [bacterium]
METEKVIKALVKYFEIPKSKIGKLAVLFAIIMAASMALSILIVLIIGGGSVHVAKVINDSPILLVLNVILNLSLNLAGLFSLVLGLYSFIRNKEWLVARYLAVLYFFIVILFILGEFLFPH